MATCGTLFPHFDAIRKTSDQATVVADNNLLPALTDEDLPKRVLDPPHPFDRRMVVCLFVLNYGRSRGIGGLGR